MTHLECSECTTRYEVSSTARWRCECGGPLDFSNRPVPSGSPPAFNSLDSQRGIWAFSDFLPITQRVTLGEGFTPLVYLDDWDAWGKLEYVSPSGSFKDRGAAAMVSHAVDLGVPAVVEDSSGNAGMAVAQYAALAGLATEIFVPASVSSVKRRVIEQFGAEVTLVDGSRDAVAVACIREVESGDAWYASHVWNPAFFMGTMTFALEICAQREWVAPNAVVCPVGNGTLILGAYLGFDALMGAGWIETMPRLLGVQAVGYDPIAEEFDGPSDGENSVAAGIQVAEPARKSQIEAAINATKGYAISVTEAEVRSALDRLHLGGFLVEPTGAVAGAGLVQYREREFLSTDADVVVPLTGSGLKSL